MSNITYIKFPSDIKYIRSEEFFSEKRWTKLPLLGTIAAGAPILAEEYVEDYYSVPKRLIKSDMDGFLLKVRGNSMVDANIQENDLLVCKIQNEAENGDIVVALIDNEATVKRYYKEKNRIRLQPENRQYKPLYVSADFAINGKVVGLIREH